MDKDPYRYFRPEVRDILDQFSRGILDLEKGTGGVATVQRLLRLAHTLKGAARVVKQVDIANRAHAIEDRLAPFRDRVDGVGRDEIDTVLQHLDAINTQLGLLPPPAEGAGLRPDRVTPEDQSHSIRADLADCDAVLDGLTEMHALLNRLRTAANGIEKATHLCDRLTREFSTISAAEHVPPMGTESRAALTADELRKTIGRLARGVGTSVGQLDNELHQLRQAAQRVRMAPTQSLFTILERTARDTAMVLSKDVGFTGTGGDVRLDIHVLETMRSALVQIVRNAVAHGIEETGERARLGKDQQGRVSVAVARRGRRIVFSCCDDGRGINLAEVRRAAVQGGLIDASPGECDDSELVRILLRGGISTARQVTEVSGRGIGLDIVRAAVERLGGEIECRSSPGSGTIWDVIIPASLASLHALIVETDADGVAMAIPLEAVRATRRISAADVSVATQCATVIYEDKAIKFVPLAVLMDRKFLAAVRSWSVVIVASGDNVAALGVERICGVAEVVVRPLPRQMSATPLVAAALIDAEGNPQLVLDPEVLVASAHHASIGDSHAATQKQPILVVDDSLTTRMLERSILESAGYDVELATSGEEALERVHAKRYSLVLIDVEMPGMDGFTLIERMRSDARTRDVPAILVTSLGGAEHRERGRVVGAQAYVSKSEFDQAELLSTIELLTV